MAFIRTEKKKSGTYLRLVESVRQDGKICQITIASLGRAEDYTPEMLKNIGRKFFELGGGDPVQLADTEIVEIGRFNYGFPQIVRAGLRHFALDRFFARLSAKHKLSFSLGEILTLLLCERLSEPASKLAGFHRQKDYIGLESAELHHIYRSLNYFAKYKEQIQYQVFNTGRDLYNRSLDVVFYDVTTFYFDSEKEDDLRAPGFGKDGKIGKVQIVLGLLIDKDKNPVAYQVYRGNTAETKTFNDSINTLKKKYLIDKVVVVADRGMLSRANVDAAAEHYEYVLGERLKSLPEALKTQLTDLKNYTQSWVFEKDGETQSIKYCTLKHENRTIICTYSEKRAKREALKREKREEKARQFLSQPSSLKRKAKSFFIRTEGEKYVLDEEAIRTAKKYEGFLAVATNSELPAEQLLEQYRQLFRIEQVFRTFKSHLEVRPMFHWTPERIEGHLAMCYMAYAIENQLLNKLKKAGAGMSEERLRRALDGMQTSLIQQGKQQYYLRGNLKSDSQILIQKAGLKALPNLIPKDKIINYLA